MKLLLNGRFTLQSVSGVQRYAHSVTSALTEILGPENIQVIVPAGRGQRQAPGTYLWEQLVLPISATRSDGNVLLNMCNWSPVVIHPHQPTVLVLHDMMTSRIPTAYSSFYRAARDAFHARLRHDPSTRIVAASKSAKLELEDYFQRDIDMAECGVEAPSAQKLGCYRALSAEALGGVEKFVLLVGGHDPRKNADFAISLIPALTAMGIRLVVTMRRGVSVFRDRNREGSPELIVIEDPSDAILWGLYARAIAVLQPSMAEGFGLPLLESAAVGTPFISTDVGIAKDLAVDDRQVLPLDRHAWEGSIDYLQRKRPEITLKLSEAANGYTWRKTAESLIRSCESALGQAR